MKDGELVKEGAPEENLLHPADDYVEAFVRGANRARALIVATVMKPPCCRIAAQNITEALQQMRDQKHDYGYYIGDEGYQGIVSQEALQRAAKGNGDGTIDEQMLEEVLPNTLDTDYALPVIDEEGDLRGELSRSALAEVLGDVTGNEETEKV